MLSADDRIENWKMFIEKEEEESGLKIIKLDLEEEKDTYEDLIKKYDNLIKDIERKLKSKLIKKR